MWDKIKKKCEIKIAIPIIISFISLIISTGSLYYTHLNYIANQNEKKEDIIVTDAHRYYGNYPTKLHPFADGLGILDGVWEVTISNRGSRDVSIVSWNVLADRTPMGKDGVYYTGLKQGLYDETYKEINLPISVKNGDSKRIYIRSAIIVNKKANQLLTEKYEFNKMYDINDVMKYLNENSIDIFDNTVSMKNGVNGVFEFRGDFHQQQILELHLHTGRDTDSSVQLEWYPFSK